MAQWFEEFGAPTHNPKEYRAWTTWKKGQEIRARISGKLKARKSCAILNKFVDQFFDEIKGTDPEKEASATVYSKPNSLKRDKRVFKITFSGLKPDRPCRTHAWIRFRRALPWN